MLPVESPFKIYTGLDGKPLDNGYVYFGEPNQNPITAPVTVYWDAAGTQPAAQPLRTANGYILRAGTPANVFFDGAYSELVRDHKGRQVFYARTSDDFSITTVVLNFLTNIASSAGASLIGSIQDGTGAVLRTLQSKLRDTVSVFDFMTQEQIDDALSGAAPVLDHTLAVQAAINRCILKNRDLEVPGLCRVTAPLIVDRQVDGAAYDSYFTIHTNSGGGFYVDSAINIFSSSIVDAVSPVSQLIRWRNLRFVASDSALAAYVIHGTKFLRSEFIGCNFSKIKSLVSTKYVQSIYFINCNARRWSGTFFKAAPQGYDIQVIGGLYEAGSGDCFDITSPIGCKFWTQIEGMSGTALKINGAQGVDISCYFEANGFDVDSRTGGLANNGINLHGCVISHADATYSVKWGACNGCISHGNWHTWNFHDLQTDSIVDINDVAQINLSNTGDAVSHIGYREGTTGTFTIRGSSSADYAVTLFAANFTRIGNRIEIEFSCTLTSTAVNPADTLYISAGLPIEATAAGMLCGQIQVSGSTLNNGLSPMYMFSATPARAASCIPVIPVNGIGDTWAIRGSLWYVTAQ